MDYIAPDSPGNSGSLAAEFRRALSRQCPERVVMTAPGDWRVLKDLQGVAKQCGVPLDVRDDRHFFCTVREFRDHARQRKSLRMETFPRPRQRARRA